MDNNCNTLNVATHGDDDTATSDSSTTSLTNAPEISVRDVDSSALGRDTDYNTAGDGRHGGKCLIHSGADVKYYCTQCHTAVCDTCAQTDHFDHVVIATSQTMTEDRTSLASLVFTLKQAVPQVERAIHEVEHTQRELAINTAAAESKIKSLFDELAFLVEERKQAALAELTQKAACKEHVLQEQRRSLLGQLRYMSSRCSQALETLAGGSEVDVVSTREDLTGKMRDLLSHRLVLQAETNSLVLFEPQGFDSLREMIGNVGCVCSNTAVPYLTSAGGDALSGCVAGKPALVTVSTRDRNGDLVKTGFAPLTAHISSDKLPEKWFPTVTDHRDGTYDITFVLPEVGRYNLSVCLFNQEIKDSPYTLRAVSTLESNGAGSLRTPRTLAVTEKGAKRSSSSRSHGSCCRSLTRVEDDLIMRVGVKGRNKGEFSNPQGVCCHDNKIIVADSNNQNVQVFSASGEFQLKFGTPGAGPGRIQRPTGVAVTQAGNYLVADYDNKWICEFTPEGKYVSHIGAGRLQGPKGVTVDTQGRIIVVDNKCNSVLVFLANGKLVNKFGCRGNWEEQLAGPHYAAVNSDDDVIVTDFHNHCVKVYNSHGRFKFRFGSNGEGNGQFNAPTGVAVDDKGNMLVADWGNSRIQVFDSSGSFLSFVNTASDPIYGPQGLAVASQGVLVVADSGNNCIKYYKYLQ